MKISTKMLTRAGVIAALYVALTFIVLPVASGAIQFRPSEALTALPLLFAESVPALFVGCMLANLISGAAVQDIVFGALVTLLAAALTRLVGKAVKTSGRRSPSAVYFPWRSMRFCCRSSGYGRTARWNLPICCKSLSC